MDKYVHLNEVVTQLRDLLNDQADVSATLTFPESKKLTNTQLKIETGAGEHTYSIETFSLTNTNLNGVITQLKEKIKDTPLLITSHVPGNHSDALVAAGINYADTSGNIYLKGPGIYIRTSSDKPATLPSPASAFTATGLKVIYALLTYPDLQAATYRDIQQATGVGLATVSRTLNTLLSTGHIVKTKTDALRPVDKDALRSRWELGYLETLRPKLKPTTWRTTVVALDKAREKISGRTDILIGGEEAAARLTKYLKPQTLTLHASDEVQLALRADLKLLPATGEAEVYLLEPPIPYDLRQTKRQLAPPLLVRAELLALGGDRLREIAGMLLSVESGGA